MTYSALDSFVILNNAPPPPVRLRGPPARRAGNCLFVDVVFVGRALALVVGVVVDSFESRCGS
jgi:hypothetical protein